MTSIPAGVQPAVRPSLERWHAMVAARDMTGLADIADPNAVFRSPVAHSAYAGAPALVLAIGTVVKVFDDFAYHRQLATDDGLNVVLEFSARVGDRQLKGVDLIRFDEHGKIVEFEVMVRPASGLQALGAEMAARIGARLPEFKANV
ncbi:nuclear transport factor 2 family protein [Burkholderia oklahomensis]|uniref:nuclear transport factor 2 family protein n=1 Tax=Burkholderia oklahomensis TaxID=342113 RepID=UPI00016A571D|nr:nuclear transport factor 2 family protein [Burkholderia oklahomensis]AOI39275.1 polyketide cyclase [Burkholderia oklahomensis EO147]AOI48964.1 polyketide cyclase [Burkholderia oklahomensis C6786]KUY50435.1 polyketide cyclase [Burkholderia oklahomensis C6786]KUY51765.1 polyketide cyclase [Burkholderia oklahomensis EO147]MBI0362818.1 nuclear transport factor 2 family protein [Burkholderia oklahomensis]